MRVVATARIWSRAVNKVKVGFFSFTEITDPAAHREYNEWHQLDHMPEQFPMRGTRVRAALGDRRRRARRLGSSTVSCSRPRTT